MDRTNSIPDKYVIYKTIGELLFSVIACMGFFISVWNRNLNSAIWCLPLGITCILLLVFNKLLQNGKLNHNYNSSFFRALKFVALLFIVASWLATLSYFILGIVKKEYSYIRSNSYLIAVPVSFFTAFWCLILFFDSQKYEIILAQEELKRVREQLIKNNGIQSSHHL